ncbi:MAG: 4Fe-4S ferredoxin, partial [Desulfobacca sp.]|nr:4Fe-4S ferredoxin [Desulfobacca sp.]
MAHPVYFLDLKASPKENRLERLGRLMDLVPFAKPLAKNNLVALKIHFGEKGNTAYVKPIYVRPIADKVRAWGGKPFLTDANTLYVGTRSDSVSHLQTALENG